MSKYTKLPHASERCGYKANLFVIAAPSGAGKTTLVHELRQRIDNIDISISYTTRPKRPREKEGESYFFVDMPTFEQMKQAGAFLEHAVIYDHYYGTARDWIYAQLQVGRDVLLEIDWQGARQIRQLFPPALLVFILPPSGQVLYERLVQRRQDDADVIAYRLSRAREEIAHYTEFDYLVVNDRFDQAIVDLQSIVMAERLQRDVQAEKMSYLLADLLKKR